MGAAGVTAAAKRLLAFCVAITYLLSGSANIVPANQSIPLLLSKIVGTAKTPVRESTAVGVVRDFPMCGSWVYWGLMIVCLLKWVL